MVDPATFRRLKPNYQFSSIKPKETDLLSDSEPEGDAEEINESSSSSSDDHSQSDPLEDTDEYFQKKYKQWKKTHKKKLIKDPDEPEGYHFVWVNIDEKEPEDIETLPGKEQAAENNDSTSPTFRDEEYLIASPVALGFSFTEKMWLEFAVSGIRDIQWNEGAFDSLIIPDDQKTVVKAMVESHEFEASKNIDDIIQGKGRGLVVVLHGPPGTGKTLTAEGIAELLRKPLYVRQVPRVGFSPLLLVLTVCASLIGGLSSKTKPILLSSTFPSLPHHHFIPLPKSGQAPSFPLTNMLGNRPSPSANLASTAPTSSAPLPKSSTWHTPGAPFSYSTKPTSSSSSAPTTTSPATPLSAFFCAC